MRHIVAEPLLPIQRPSRFCCCASTSAINYNGGRSPWHRQSPPRHIVQGGPSADGQVRGACCLCAMHRAASAQQPSCHLHRLNNARACSSSMLIKYWLKKSTCRSTRCVFLNMTCTVSCASFAQPQRSARVLTSSIRSRSVCVEAKLL